MTPVGNVVSDAVPDRTEAEDVAVILLDVLGDGVSDALNVDVFEPVLDAVIVLVAPAVFEITAVGEPVVETDEVLLDDALPLVVGDDVDDRDARPDSVSIRPRSTRVRSRRSSPAAARQPRSAALPA